MDQEVFKSRFPQLRSTLRNHFGELTDADMEQIGEGDYDALCGRVEERYGLTREETDAEVAKVYAEPATPIAVGNPRPYNPAGPMGTAFPKIAPSHLVPKPKAKTEETTNPFSTEEVTHEQSRSRRSRIPEQARESS